MQKESGQWALQTSTPQFRRGMSMPVYWLPSMPLKNKSKAPSISGIVFPLIPKNQLSHGHPETVRSSPGWGSIATHQLPIYLAWNACV